MQLVLPFEHMAKAAQYMEPSVFEYVREGEIESFESFEKFDFLAFDWYDVHSERAPRTIKCSPMSAARI